MSKEEKNREVKDIFIKNSSDEILWKFPNHPFEWNIYLEDGLNFQSKAIIEAQNINGIIHIYSGKRTKCHISLGIVFNKNNHLEIRNILKHSNCESKIKLHLFQKDNCKSTILTEGIIEENTTDNDFIEEVRVLVTDEEKIECIPNLIVHSSEANANHLVTLATFKEEDIFYLESKGLSIEEAKNLLTTSFINSMIK